MKLYSHNVATEMATRGLVPIFAQAQHGSTPTRIARVLKVFGLPARLQKSLGPTTPMLGGQRKTELTLFTNVEGQETAALVVKAAQILGKLHMVSQDRFALGRVAERLHAEPELLGVFRAAYNFDADEATLELILWPIRDTILPVPPVKTNAP